MSNLFNSKLDFNLLFVWLFSPGTPLYKVTVLTPIKHQMQPVTPHVAHNMDTATPRTTSSTVSYVSGQSRYCSHKYQCCAFVNDVYLY